MQHAVMSNVLVNIKIAMSCKGLFSILRHCFGPKAPQRHASMEFEDFGARFSVAVEDFSGSWSLLQEVSNVEGVVQDRLESYMSQKQAPPRERV